MATRDSSKLSKEEKREKARLRAKAWREKKKAEKESGGADTTDESSPPSSDSDDASYPEEEYEEESKTREQEEKRRKPPSNSTKTTKAAAMFANSLVMVNQRIREKGATPWIPDELILTIVYEAAKQCAEKYLPDIEPAPEYVLAASAIPLVQLLFFTGKPKPEPKKGPVRLEVVPPPAETKEEPVVEEPASEARPPRYY